MEKDNCSRFLNDTRVALLLFLIGCRPNYEMAQLYRKSSIFGKLMVYIVTIIEST